MSPVKVLVVADRPAIAESIVAAMEAAIPGVEALDVEAGGDALLRRLGDVLPDVVVVDLDVPASTYRVLCGQVRERGVPAVFVVEDATEGLALLRASVDGIVATDAGLDGVLCAVRTVLDGHVYVAPTLLTEVLRGLLEQGVMVASGPADSVRNLTEREREVLALLGDGSDVADIAGSLCISPETAKTHIRHVLHKLGVRSRVEAAAVAAEAGLVCERARP